MSGATTAVCVPLMIQGRVTGVIYLDRISSDRILTLKDIESVGPLAGFIALKVENMRLTHSHVRSQILLRDLELAKSIQEGLHPRDTVRLESFDFEGYSEPCYEVCGDYYDFLSRDASSVLIVLGDVSGKGLSSALYMAGVRSALHAHWEDGLQLSETMTRLEGHARRTFRDNYFLTMVLGEIDGSGRFRYCNAGHLSPVLVSADGQARELEGADPALNVLDIEEFQQCECGLSPGDLLFLFTDGLVEAESSAGDQYGVERLTQSLIKHQQQDLPAVRRGVLGDLDSFTGADSARDDRTLILVRRQ